MAAWLPVTASILAVSGFAAAFSPGGDCAECTAPATTAPAAVAPVDTMVDAAENDKMKKHDVYVLKFHADWCPKCKSLNPVYDAAVKDFKDKAVGFGKVDVTNDSTKKASEAKLKKLGLEDIWAKYGGQNGFILLVDAETKEVVKNLGVGTTKDQATKAIKAALAG